MRLSVAIGDGRFYVEKIDRKKYFFNKADYEGFVKGIPYQVEFAA